MQAEYKDTHLNYTVANVLSKKDQTTTVWLRLMAASIALFWILGYIYCIDRDDWLLENILVIIFLCLLVYTRQWHRFSLLSYFLIFCFLLLHLYGAFYAYTQNALGNWLQHTFQLWRNPYDRIVHFSFGLLAAFPIRELLITKFKVSKKAGWLLPIEIAFSLGTVFEMIEWGVSAIQLKKLGKLM
jgi:putative membrane protein